MNSHEFTIGGNRLRGRVHPDRLRKPAGQRLAKRGHPRQRLIEFRTSVCWPAYFRVWRGTSHCHGQRNTLRLNENCSAANTEIPASVSWNYFENFAGLLLLPFSFFFFLIPTRSRAFCAIHRVPRCVQVVRNGRNFIKSFRRCIQNSWHE